MANKINISKLDAAVRQLDIAIKLFMNYGDIVSTHTLIAASHGILHDISVNQKITSLKTRLIKGYVKEDQQKAALKILNEAQNFFKHANRDPKGLLEFNTNQTEILIWDACNLYFELAGERKASHILFTIYFNAKHSNLIHKDKIEKFNQMLSNIDIDFSNRQAVYSLIQDLESSYYKK